MPEQQGLRAGSEGQGWVGVGLRSRLLGKDSMRRGAEMQRGRGARGSARLRGGCVSEGMR